MTYDPEEARDERGQWTEAQITQDWLDRNQVPKTPEGKYVFYHAAPKLMGVSIRKSGLRPGSLLETDTKRAAFFARRDRRPALKVRDVEVHRIEVNPDEIRTGSVFASTKGVVFPAKVQAMTYDPGSRSSRLR